MRDSRALEPKKLPVDLLVESAHMLEMSEALDFEICPDPDDLWARRVRLKLPAHLQDLGQFSLTLRQMLAEIAIRHVGEVPLQIAHH